MSYSEYYSTLMGDVKCRYDEKIKIIDNIDPYTLGVETGDLSADLSILPCVSVINMVNYLVSTHSFFADQQLKAYKSLQAYKYYEAGFVQEVCARKINSNVFIVMGKVLMEVQMKSNENKLIAQSNLNKSERSGKMLLKISTKILPEESAKFLPNTSFPGVQHTYKSDQKSLKNVINSNAPQYKWVWFNIVVLAAAHLISVYGVWLMITQAMWRTFIFFNVYSGIIFFGVTAGVHRLWSHRAYKAKLPLRIFLMLCQSAAFQNDIYEWTRDHRVHHKYADTDADPHNSRRGFFFSHIGWLMVKKHEDVFTKGRTNDLSDLKADPVVMFQHRYYGYLLLLFCFIIPTFIPYYFWSENWRLSLIVVGITRWIYVLHATFCINSVAHMYGVKPYDKYIKPVESKFVSWIAYGEGWHNYHHAFPWDYKAAELGNYKLNISTAFIELMAILGQAYDLKTASPEIVKKRVQRTGDGSWKDHSSSNITNGIVNGNQRHIEDYNVWGWGDKDMKQDDIEHVKNYCKLNE